MKRTLVSAVVIGIALAGLANAGIIAVETWESGTPGDDQGWAVTPGPPNGQEGLMTGSDAPGSPYAPSFGYQVTQPSDPLVFPAFGNATVSSLNDPAGLTGNWAADSTDFIMFDFYLDADAVDNDFAGLNVFFVSGTVTWSYVITGVENQAADSWVTYGVPVTSDGAGWNPSSPSTFSSDIAAVTALGFEIAYVTGATSQTYGFDNVRRGFSVPEPETYAAIGFALVALAMAFRKQLTDMLAVIRVPSAL